MRALWLGLLALGAGASLWRCSGDDATCAGDAGDACTDITPTALSLALSPSEIWVHPSDAPSITVALARGPGGGGDAVVSIETDAGVTADPLTIPSASVTGTLVLHIASTFGQGEPTITVNAQTNSISQASAQSPLIVHVAGASGLLDTSFGAGGLVDLSPSTGNDVAHAMISLQSGLMVGGTHVELGDASSVSTMKVLRLTGSGAVDGAFAVTYAPGELASLAMLPDARIFAVGDVRTPPQNGKANFAAVRIRAAGGLDPLYSVTTALTTLDDIGLASGIQPGGALVAAGYAGDASAFGLTRYTQSPPPPPPSDAGSDADASDASLDAPIDVGVVPTSVLDPTFGDGGVVLTSFTTQPSAGAASLLVAPDGSLFALGFAAGASTDLVAVRYTQAGGVDATYGTGGVASVPLTSGTFGAAAAILDPNGRAVVASDDDGQALVVRLLGTGAIDGAFGSGGRAAMTVGSSSAARALALDPASGKIIVGGSTGASHQCFVARLTPAGALDTTFAQSGLVVTTGSTTCDVAAVAVDDSGLILVLETITQGSSTHMVVARYWP